MARISPEKYREILNGLRLESISLVEVNAHLDRDLLEAPLHIISDSKGKYQKRQNKVTIFDTYIISVRGKNEDKPAMSIKATFELVFTSNRDFTAGFFEIYKKTNLHLHVWPYMRELVNSLTSRMNIPPITLPLLKM
jgi:hypothetical protein